jgi:hypothetical protein
VGTASLFGIDHDAQVICQNRGKSLDEKIGAKISACQLPLE